MYNGWHYRSCCVFLVVLFAGGFFSGVLENAWGQESFSPTEAAPMAPPKPKPDERIRVLLDDGSQLIGMPMTAKEIVVKTKVGEIRVPFKELAAAVLVSSAPSNSKVTLTNGDCFTGEISFPELRLKSTWGETTLSAQHIVSLWSNAYGAQAAGAITIQRPIVETLPGGETRVRIVTEVVNAGNALSYGGSGPYPASGPYSAPAVYAPAAPSTPVYRDPSAPTLPPPRAFPAPTR